MRRVRVSKSRNTAAGIVGGPLAGAAPQGPVRADLKSVALREYQNLFGNRGDRVATRKRHYAAMVNRFYDLVTDFYEFAWGRSFHFAPRMIGESFHGSLARCERDLADRLGLKPGMRVLDVGCGVGGPTREIAGHSGACVVGINDHVGQVRRADDSFRRAGIDGLCIPVVADFMRIPFDDGAFDAVYALEATVHAPNRHGVFGEIFRVLRPDGLFACQEWCLTAAFDPGNCEHRKLKGIIEVGNALPEIATTGEIPGALDAVGFEVIEARDSAADSDPEAPWYRALEGRDLTLFSRPRTPAGRALTNGITKGLETLRIAAAGTAAVSTLLIDADDALTEAGVRGIFTPLFICLARKPNARCAGNT